MSKKNERNLNITIANQEDQESEVVVSISTILNKLKKYLAIWIAAAIVAGVIAVGYAGFTTHVKKQPLQALVGYSWSGIEKGLDPSGRKFDPLTLKDPSIIEASLYELEMDESLLESIRKNISMEGVRPKDAIDRMTLYGSIIDKVNGSSAVDKVLETSYFSTQYKVYFDYSGMDITDDEAVDVFNMILEKYDEYLYKKYGYNETIGSAAATVNYEDYDYSQAIDVFSTSLNSLARYVRQLSNEDSTKFRSADTGYTFSDLYEAINTTIDIDLDVCTSYINVHNITKDKDSALAYCEYRIKSMNRKKTQLEEELNGYNAAIDAYQKDDIIIFGGSAGDDTTTQTKVASAQYDKMFNERNAVTNELAATKQRINYYKERQESIKSTTVGSQDKAKEVEKQLARISERINELVDLVSRTADDYYVNVTFKNAYNVLVPATNTTSDRMHRVVENAKLPIVILEGLAVAVYCAVAFIEALVCDSRKRKAALAGVIEEDDEDETEEDDDADSEDEEPAEEEKKTSASDKKKNRKK